MSDLWEQCAAFALTPDLERKGVRRVAAGHLTTPPGSSSSAAAATGPYQLRLSLPAWLSIPQGAAAATSFTIANLPNMAGVQGEGLAMSYAAALVLAMLHKCNGNDAVVAVDAVPPRPIANVFAEERFAKDVPFSDAVAFLAQKLFVFEAQENVTREKAARRRVVDRIAEEAEDLQSKFQEQSKQSSGGSKKPSGAAAPAVPVPQALGFAAVLFKRTLERVPIECFLQAYDVVFLFEYGGGKRRDFTLEIVFNAAVYLASSPWTWLHVLEKIAHEITASSATGGPPTTVHSIDPLTPMMRQLLMSDWQPEEILLPKGDIDRSLDQVFEHTVDVHCVDHDPRKQLAVIEPRTARKVTYHEMSIRSTKLAWWMRETLGRTNEGRWGVDATCGIYVPRCADWYLLMVAIHKAGGAYLSLDPDFPPDRLSFALEDSSAVCLFTLPSMNGTLAFDGPTFELSDAFWAQIDAVEVVGADAAVDSWNPKPILPPAASFVHATLSRPRLPKQYSTPSSPCYLIYTSGSTGKPKGVLIEHRCAVNFVMSERRMYHLSNQHRILQGFSTSFDASVEELWLAFASGSALIVVEKATLSDPELLGKLVSENRATVFSTVPTLLATMDPAKFESLKIVITGGEACNKEVIETYARPGVRMFVNSYGPTEATVACMFEVCDPHKPVTIGRAQPGFFAAIVNERRELVPPGVPGELIVAGPSVARGYVNRPDLTEEKFVSCPFFPDLASRQGYREIKARRQDTASATAGGDPMNPEADGDEYPHPRMYHTGDLTRWNHEGKVEFLGRIDTQVKLRGFRIEVGEIETHLASYPGVKTAIVHLRNDDGNPYLCAYFLPHDGDSGAHLHSDFDEAKCRDFLKGKVPHYMVPSRFCVITVIPRSPAGKLDRKQLPPPPPPKKSGGANAADVPKVPPGTLLEKVVFKSWTRAFPASSVFGIDDNFFEVGGHSLLAGKVASDLRKRSSAFAEVNIRTVYNFATIRTLAAELQRMRTSSTTNKLPVLRELPVREEPGAIRMVMFMLVQLFVFHVCLISQWIYLLGFLSAYIFFENDNGLSNRYGWPLTVFLFGLMFQAIGLGVFFAYNFVLLPAMKWIIFLGRVQAGNYSIWSVYFLRWWAVRALGQAQPVILYQGTWLINLHYRLMGASLGRRTVVLCRIVDFDLVSVGADCYLGDNCVFATSEVIDSILHLRAIEVDAGTSILARACLRGGCRVGRHCIIRPLSLIKENAVIPDGEVWGGSPAVRVGQSPSLGDMLQGPMQANASTLAVASAAASAQRIGSHRSINDDAAQSVSLLGSAQSSQSVHVGIAAESFINTVQFIFVCAVGTLLTNPTGMLFFAAWLLFDLLRVEGMLYYDVLVVPLAPLLTLIVMLFQHLMIAAIRYVVFPWNVQPGAYASTDCNGVFHRKVLLDVLARFSLMFAHQMYGTLFTQYFLRWMGCKVGSSVECSNLYGWTPGITEFGDETFVADFVGVNPPFVHRGVMVLDKVVIERRAFVGNGAVLPPGTRIGTGALVGLSSIPAEAVVLPNTTVIGSPAFPIPRQASADSVDQAATFQPTNWLVCRRIIWETFRCIMPASFISFSGLVAFLVIIPLTSTRGRNLRHEDVHFVELLNIFVWIVSLSNIIFVLAAKWLVVGRHAAEEHPLWSAGVWRSEFAVDVVTVVSLAGIVNLFRGSVLLPTLFRLLGAKIGKNCYLDTIFLTEPDMVTLGDGCCVNENATIQTHLFEDRVMKVDYMEMKERCSVGHYGIVLYNTLVERGCTIAPLSLVMKGESFMPMTHWEGVPAQRRAPPDVMVPLSMAGLTGGADAAAAPSHGRGDQGPLTNQGPMSGGPPSKLPPPSKGGKAPPTSQSSGGAHHLGGSAPVCGPVAAGLALCNDLLPLRAWLLDDEEQAEASETVDLAASIAMDEA